MLSELQYVSENLAEQNLILSDRESDDTEFLHVVLSQLAAVKERSLSIRFFRTRAIKSHCAYVVQRKRALTRLPIPIQNIPATNLSFCPTTVSNHCQVGIHDRIHYLF